VLDSLWAALGGDHRELARLEVTGPRTTLTSTFAVTEAATAAVGASLLAATLGSGARVAVDTRQLAVAVRSERYVRRDGRSGGNPFDPLSAFHRTADGWLRLHANYAWHREAALRVLGCAEAEAPVAIARRDAVELETALHAAGGVGAAVRTEAQWRVAAGPPPPLVERRDLAPAAPRPARRPRVLDLTRVIAGPVGTRMLAALGADVLRVDNPQRPELPLHMIDGTIGKASTLLDAGTPAGRDALHHLLGEADVLVTGYRPGALRRLGLAPDQVAERHPGTIVVTLSAWGTRDATWGTRRGFDSLVQVATGIGWATSPDGEHVGVLPCQLLDHASGYLIAAGALSALAHRERTGGASHVSVALARTARWLLAVSAERGAGAEPSAADADAYRVDLGNGWSGIAPPGTVDGRPLTWPRLPPAYGAAAPRWHS